MKAFALVAVLLTGCVSSDRVVGDYESIQGGFSETIGLEVKKDRTYVLRHHFIGDVIDKDGKFNGFYGEDFGTWTLSENILILSPTKIGSDHSAMFLPAYCDRFEIGKEGELTSVSTPAIPASVPTKVVLKKGPTRR